MSVTVPDNSRDAARPKAAGTARRHLARFARDESGALAIWSIFMFLMMMIVGGIGADFMLNEMRRTQLQGTLDRAVLAAADLDQTLDAETVVADYFDKAGMGDYLESVTVQEGLNYKIVSAQANSETDTLFIDFLGVDKLPAPASGEAEERVANVEISMVLDISGSMGHYAGKMQNLRNAASEFVDAVLRPETEDLVSLSIVPYTAHVNAGPVIFDALNVNQRHDFSHCVEFNNAEFDTTVFNTTRTYEQGQHFEASSAWHNPIRNPGCPMRSYERITPLSQNGGALKYQIGQLTPRANTSIHLGMKWGVSLLDPSFQPLTQTLSAGGHVDSVFRDRPAAYDDPETLKTVVLMTDGENVRTYRIADWAYDSSSEYAHWNRWTLFRYLYNHVHSYHHNQFYYTKYTPHQGDTLLHNICDAAKDRGIVIWTIGFHVGDHGADVMRRCASSPSHFFRVEGVEITSAFQAIARQINQLRLTQ